MNRRVAVIIPCFNEGDALCDAAMSVLAQDGVGERVIVDDGSTSHETQAILTGLQCRGFRVIHQDNAGPSAALMRGVRATTSPFVFRLDSDDALEPGAIESLAGALEANRGAAAAWGDFATSGLTSYRVPASPALDPWFATFANLLPSCSMFRRSALVAVGGWQFRGGVDDWDLWMSLAEAGYSGVYVPRVVYRYRRSPTGLLADVAQRFETDYEELRSNRHPRLFADRAVNRRRSTVPATLKLLVPLIDRLPFVSRLQKVWLTELAAHLLWNGGPRVTAEIFKQGVALRLRALSRVT